MAISNVQQRPDLTAVETARDVEPILESILTKYPVTQLLVVNGGQTAYQNKHEWFDDQITQATATLTADIAAHAASATGLAMIVDSTTNFRVGDQLFVDLMTQVYQITAVTNATDLVVSEIRGVALGTGIGTGNTVRYTRGVLEI